MWSPDCEKVLVIIIILQKSACYYIFVLIGRESILRQSSRASYLLVTFGEQVAATSP